MSCGSSLAAGRCLPAADERGKICPRGDAPSDWPRRAAMWAMFAAISGRCARVMREGGAIPETAGSQARHFGAFGGPHNAAADRRGARNARNHQPRTLRRHRATGRVLGLAGRWQMGGRFPLGPAHDGLKIPPRFWVAAASSLTPGKLLELRCPRADNQDPDLAWPLRTAIRCPPGVA